MGCIAIAAIPFFYGILDLVDHGTGFSLFKSTAPPFFAFALFLYAVKRSIDLRIQSDGTVTYRMSRFGLGKTSQFTKKDITEVVVAAHIDDRRVVAQLRQVRGKSVPNLEPMTAWGCWVITGERELFLSLLGYTKGDPEKFFEDESYRDVYSLPQGLAQELGVPLKLMTRQKGFLEELVVTKGEPESK